MPRLRSRLAVRIYLAGLAQVAAVILGFVLLVRMRGAADHKAEREARASVEAVVAVLGDPAALARELERVALAEDATIVVYDDASRVLATSSKDGDEPLAVRSEGPPPGPRPLGPPPGPPPELRGRHGPPPGPPPDGFGGPPGPSMPAFVLPVRLPSGQEGRAVWALRRPRGPSRDAPVIIVLVLVVFGVASLLTARSLAKPLAQLSSAARALGAGKLDARAAMTRSDEIGDVAAAFDEMADRVRTLLHAEKELLANVSHELRTPLARIRVALDLAAEGDAATARAALADIGEDLAELETLIGDVLTAARLDLEADGAPSGAPSGPPLRLARVDPGELVERAAARFRLAHPERPLDVTVAPNLPSLEGDGMLLRRVLDNLLENAHRYAKGGADAVELVASRASAGLAIEVRDRGIGIAEDDLPHVFRPFFRADRSRVRATGGLGLGLALARRIVVAHGGSIEIESQLGEGTCARVRLPARPPEAPAHTR